MDCLPGVNTFAHYLIKRCVKSGSFVVDATCGNGNDTLFLAELVGNGGLVYAFDIQKKALEITEGRLQEKGLLDRVHLVHDGHENLSNYVKQPVSAAMFNLGYLPGGDHQLVTRSLTTIKALHQLVSLLERKGIITIVCYTGHPGGASEAKDILNYSQQLDYQKWVVIRYDYVNQKNNPPFVIAFERR
ncbi:MAG: class I SAM-dependent methyltransferase [Dethiobacteria bacterium]|jgi:SAM-dependent methyltransferase